MALDTSVAIPLLVSSHETELARLGIAGGATYDALVALAAREHDALLATRDTRARTTPEAIGARVEVVA